MKWMIASDLHGSAYYCKLLMQRWAEEQADTFLFLGDILYHGPRNDLPRDYAPKEVIAMLNPLADKLLCVRGNCDCEVDQMVLQFPILADYAVLAECGRRIYLTHGHVINKGHPLPFAEGDILLPTSASQAPGRDLDDPADAPHTPHSAWPPGRSLHRHPCLGG